MKKLFPLVITILAATAGALLATRLLGPDNEKANIAATVFQTSRPLPNFELVDHAGKTFTQSAFKNQWSLAFFGFTHCPDVCPTTLYLLSQTKESLSDLPEEEQPTIVMVSVDPARDTPEKMADYVPHFGDDIVGVTGSLPAIQTLTESLGVAYAYTPDGKGGYTVDHTASIFLISPQAELKAVFTTPHESISISRDFRHIISKF